MMLYDIIWMVASPRQWTVFMPHKKINRTRDIMSISFSRVTNVSLKERAVRELENKILSGELQPGLTGFRPSASLRWSMGISRSLVNLCILELESRGFVRIVPRQGTFVNDYKKQGTPQMLL